MKEQNLSADKKTGVPDYKLIAILISGAFVSLLANTFLNVALPSIQNDFNITTSTVQWVSTGYMLTSGIVIPVTAYLMTRFHTRSLFLAAMLFFLTGTILAGTAPVFGVLLMGRMTQAIGSAILMPLLMNVIISNFPIERRGYALGLFSFVMFFAPAIGPTLSGVIVEFFTWRYLFLLIAPVVLAVIIFGYFKIPSTPSKKEAHLDIPSVILSTIGFGGLLYGLSSAGNDGWTNPVVITSIVIGFVALIIYITRQWRLPFPMLNFKAFKFPMFALSMLIISTINMAIFSGFILMPMYLIEVQGRSPIEAGLLIMPGALIMGMMSPISGRLYDKFGAKPMAMIGLPIAIATNFYFSTVDADTSFMMLMLVFSIRSFGMTLVITPLMTNGMNQLTPELTPHGSSINSMVQQVSGAIGTATLIAIMQTRMDNLLAAGETSQLAMLDGINLTFLIASIILTVSFTLTFFIKRVRTDGTIGKGIKQVKVIK